MNNKKKSFYDSWTFRISVFLVGIFFFWMFDWVIGVFTNDEPEGMNRQEAVSYVETLYDVSDTPQEIIETREWYADFLRDDDMSNYFHIEYDNDLDAFVFIPIESSWHYNFTYGKVGDSETQVEYRDTLDVLTDLGPLIHGETRAGFIIMSPEKEDTLLFWMFNNTIVYNRADELVE